MPSVIHRCFSSICLSLITSAGVFTTGVVAPTSAHKSAGRAAAGGRWPCTSACWSSWSGKPILATSCWRPTGHWPSSCLPYVPGLFSWACCWCTKHGGELLLVSRPTGHCDAERGLHLYHCFVPSSSLLSPLSSQSSNCQSFPLHVMIDKIAFS